MESSERASAIILAFRKLEGLTDDQLARLTGGVIPLSTLNRLTTAGGRFSIGQVNALVGVIAARLPCDFHALLAYIDQGSNPPPAISNLLAGSVYGLTEESLTRLMLRLNETERTMRLCQILGDFPSSILLTEEVMRKLYRRLAQSFAGHAERHYDLMMKFGRRRQSRFFLEVGQKPTRTNVFISEERLRTFLTRDLDKSGYSMNDVDALVETWIFDHLYNRNVHFGIFNASPGTIGAFVNAYLQPYDAVALFDHQEMIKRLKGKPGTLWFSRQDSNTAAGRMIDEGAAMIEAARRAVPYDLDDKQEVEKALKAFLSPRTWAYCSLNAKLCRLYRPPNLN
jgi:hypothetical protein